MAPASLWHLDQLIRTYLPLARINATRNTAFSNSSSGGGSAWPSALAPPVAATAEPLLHVVSLFAERGPDYRALAARSQAAVAAFNWAFASQASFAPTAGVFPVTPGMVQAGFSATFHPADNPAPATGPDGAAAGAVVAAPAPAEADTAWLEDCGAGLIVATGPAGSVLYADPAPALTAAGLPPRATADAAVAAAARPALALAAATPVMYHAVPITDAPGALPAATERLAAIARRCGVFAAAFVPLDRAVTMAEAGAAERGGYRARWLAQTPLGAALAPADDGGAGEAGGAVCGVLARVTVPLTVTSLRQRAMQGIAVGSTVPVVAQSQPQQSQSASEDAPVAGAVVVSRQHAVMRTHCIDCLDRAGKAQAIALAAAAPLQLVALGLGPTLAPGAVDPAPRPAGALPAPVVLFSPLLTPPESDVANAAHTGAAPQSQQSTLSLLSRFTADGSAFDPNKSVLAPSPLLRPSAAAAAAGLLPARGGDGAGAGAGAGVTAWRPLGPLLPTLLELTNESNDQLALMAAATPALFPLALAPPRASALSAAAHRGDLLAAASLTGATHSAHRTHTALVLPYKPLQGSARGEAPAQLTARALAAAADAAAGRPTAVAVPPALVRYVRAHPGAVAAPPAHLPMYLALQIEAMLPPPPLRALLLRPWALLGSVAAAALALPGAITSKLTPGALRSGLVMLERNSFDRAWAARLGDDARLFRTAYRPQRHLLYHSGAQIVRDPDAPAGTQARFMIEPLPDTAPRAPHPALLALAALAAVTAGLAAAFFSAHLVPIPAALTELAPDWVLLLVLGLLPVNLPTADALHAALSRGARAPVPAFRALQDVTAGYAQLRARHAPGALPPLLWRCVVRQWPLWRHAVVLVLGTAVLTALLAWWTRRRLVAVNVIPWRALSDPVDFGPPAYAKPHVPSASSSSGAKNNSNPSGDKSESSGGTAGGKKGRKGK